MEAGWKHCRVKFIIWTASRFLRTDVAQEGNTDKCGQVKGLMSGNIESSVQSAY